MRKGTNGEPVLTASGAALPVCDQVLECNGTITCEVPGNPVCSECAPGRFGPRCAPIPGCEVPVVCIGPAGSSCPDCADGLVGLQCTVELAVSSPVGRVFVRDAVQLVRSGGVAPFEYEVMGGGAAVDGGGRVQIGDLEGLVTVTVSDASGQSASVGFTVVRACAANSPWTTILDESAGYTNDVVGFNAPIRTELTVDSMGNLYLPASIGEWGGAKTWTLARWAQSSQTWSELDRYQRPYSASSRSVGLFVGGDGRVFAPGSANPNSIDSFGVSVDGAAWNYSTLPRLDAYEGSVIGLNHFVVETQGALFLAASGAPSAESNSGAAGLLYKSTDGGATWSLLHRYQYGGSDVYYRAALRDTDGGLILVGVNSIGTNATIIYRKTIDGGATFTESTDSLSNITNNHYYLYAAHAGDRKIAFAYRSSVYHKDLDSGVLTLVDTVGDAGRYRYNAFIANGAIAYAAGFYLTTSEPAPQRWFVRRVDLTQRTGTTIDDYAESGNDVCARANSITLDVDGRLSVPVVSMIATISRPISGSTVKAGSGWWDSGIATFALNGSSGGGTQTAHGPRSSSSLARAGREALSQSRLTAATISMSAATADRFARRPTVVRPGASFVRATPS